METPAAAEVSLINLEAAPEQMEEDEGEGQPEIIYGLPWKASVAKKLRKQMNENKDNQIDSKKFFEKHAEGGNVRAAKLYRLLRLLKVFMIVVFVAHFLSIRSLKFAQMGAEKATQEKNEVKVISAAPATIDQEMPAQPIVLPQAVLIDNVIHDHDTLMKNHEKKCRELGIKH